MVAMFYLIIQMTVVERQVSFLKLIIYSGITAVDFDKLSKLYVKLLRFFAIKLKNY